VFGGGGLLREMAALQQGELEGGEDLGGRNKGRENLGGRAEQQGTLPVDGDGDFGGGGGGGGGGEGLSTAAR